MIQEVKYMQRLGFIHDMLDVKVLVLFVMARVSYPVNIQQICVTRMIASVILMYALRFPKWSPAAI